MDPVDVYHYDPVTGVLGALQRIATHPATASGCWRSADIHLTTRIDKTTGDLKVLRRFPTVSPIYLRAMR